MSFYLGIIILIRFVELKERSKEFNECINIERTVNSPSDCLNIKIPSSEGYLCCSMKITYNSDSSYSCLAIENKYTSSKKLLNEYISQRDISFLFTSLGGQMEIECGNNLKTIENYKKLSDEYLNCYNNHLKGIENESDCFQNDIPASEASKCCFVETITEYSDGNYITDKRCYMIENKYFTTNKNLNNYILDESNINNLDGVINTNVTIRCKNYDDFFFSSINYFPPSDNIENTYLENSDISENTGCIKYGLQSTKKNSGIKAWVIILIILGALIVIGITITLIICFCRKNKTDSTQANININKYENKLKKNE